MAQIQVSLHESATLGSTREGDNTCENELVLWVDWFVLWWGLSRFSRYRPWALPGSRTNRSRGGVAKPEVEPGKLFSPFPVKDYTGGGTWLTWANATGDWGGLRNQLAKDGITFEVDTLQIFQGNTHGGADTTNAWRYSGSAEYTFRLDTGRAGLWPGGRITIRGRTRFGHGITGKVGSPVNYDALLPISGDECKTVLSEFYIEQGLSPKLILIAGKLDGARFADRNEFASDEKTQFLHVGFRANPVVLPHAPYTNLAAALIYLPTDWLSIGTFVWTPMGRRAKRASIQRFISPRGCHWPRSGA